MGTTALAASQAAFAQGDEIVVRGALIPDEKRATSEISSILDEEAFERTGDSDIAAALGRVSGISVAEGKFVIVRGLNERYSSVTLNGSPLPSPEPLRRVVPLDLIPTSFLSGSLVQKTFSPEFSGEFGGGLVELRTKAVPDEFYFDVGLSLGVDLASTGQNGLTHDGGDRDWLGFDDGTRSAPSLAEAAFFSEPFNPVADINALEAEFARPENLLAFEETLPP
ncbi:MAG: TonB-dependent receptor plug domain-containing protein, partial [Pseudomonadota bacterium]